VFIGGGLAGLINGARLKQAGVDDVRIVEKGGDFGGAWYWNRYPGAQCATASFIYMPLLEDRSCADREVRPRNGDSRALPAHRQALWPVR
jgi:cation diffusion facilitator CzcD-associated flavoprotein CzcO